MTCAVIGLFTLYLICTLFPGVLTYHFIKDTHIDKPYDLMAALKGLLIAYIIGLIAFVWVMTFFGFMRG